MKKLIRNKGRLGLAIGLMVGAAVSIGSALADPVIDGILGPADDYSHGFAVTAKVERGPTIDDAELYLHKGANGDMSVLLRFPRSLNDNSYGDTRIGWGRGVAPSGKNHNFKDLEGSDTSEFSVKLSGGGDNWLDFELDFIDEGNGGLVHGLEGEGGVSAGSASDIIATATSMSYNFARFGGSHPEFFADGADSPAASSGYVVIDPAFADWEFSIIYEFKISGAALGTWDPSNPQGVLQIGTSHHSPNKLAKNKVTEITPGDPIDPPGGGGGEVPDELCAVNTAEDCGTADEYGMWIPNLHNGQSDWTFEFADGNFSGLSSGDAHLTAIARLGNGNGFSVDVTFTDRTTVPPQGSPVMPIDGGCYSPDTSNWFYYWNFTGTLTGLPGTDYEGAVLQVTRRMKAFQVGAGANRQTNDMGASGWFDWELIQQPSTGTRFGSGANGDFNFALTSCTPDLPSISINDARELECEGPMIFEICLSEPQANPVTINYETQDGSAISGSDYTGGASSIVIPAGATCVTVSIPLLDDNEDELKEEFSVLLTSANGATITDGEGTGEIENCAPDVPEITISDLIVLECDGPAIFEICLSSLSTVDVEVDYSTIEGSAGEGRDYVNTEGTLVIRAGEICATVEVPILHTPARDENDETFELELSSARNATIADSRGEATIQECEISDTEISIADASVLECNGPIRFEVTLSAPAPFDFTLDYRTFAGTASSGDGDYNGTSGASIQFSEGDRSKFIEIVVNEDAFAEGTETFEVGIFFSGTTPNGLLIVDSRATGTIEDCDQPPTIPDDLCVVDTGLNCGAGDGYTVWIPNLHDGHTDKTFEVTSGQFTGLQSGDARLTGIARLGNGNGFIIDVTYTGRTVVPPAGSPKAPLDSNCYDMDATNWFYYTGCVGTLTGLPGTDYEGSVLTLSRRGEAFQVGVGANRQTNLLGGSGWFDWVLQQQTTTGTEIHDDGIGDFNFELEECTPELPSLSISSTGVLECEGPAEFEICLSEISPVDVSVSYSTQDGTATAPADYTSTSGQLTIPAGTLCKTIEVPVIEDTDRERLETFSLVLSNPSGATISAGTGTGEIEDCEVELPEASVLDITVNECAGQPGVFQICLNEITKDVVEVTYTTRDGTATAGDDYVAGSGTVTFAIGEQCAEVRIQILEDRLAEGPETFDLVLTGANGATIGDAVGTATIEDCPPRIPEIVIHDSRVLECDGPAVFQVCLSETTDVDVTVDFATLDGSAGAGSDYTATRGTLTIPAGELCVEVEVPVIEDQVDELPSENFFVDLSNPSGATIADGRGEGSIFDCEPDPPTLSIRDTRVAECDGPAEFQICLSEVSDEDVTVTYSTADGSAISPGDYASGSAVLTIPAGQQCVTFTVAVVDDGVDEGDETFLVNLSNPTAATIRDGEGVGTIVDCRPPTVSITGDVISECDEDVTLNVCLSEVSDTPVSIDFATADGTATAGVDYNSASGTITIPAGQLCTTITIGLLNEQVEEPNETFTVTLSNAQGAVIDNGVATVTIEDCTDPPVEDPELEILDPELVQECEDDVVIFTVCLDKVSTETVSVNWATQDLTASAGQDYVAGSGTLTFNPGVTKAQITISLIDDEDEESPETFQVVLSNPTNALIADGTGVATIQDCGDDPTAIELLSFEVQQDGVGGVVLTWTTGSELDTAGFELHRTATEGSEAFRFQKVTSKMVLSRGSVGDGASYSYQDRPGFGKFMYQLEEVELDGHRARRGTVSIEVCPLFDRIEMSPTGLVLGYPVTDGWDYVVEFTESVDGERVWSALEGAPHNSGEIIDSGASADSARFYRVTATKK